MRPILFTIMWCLLFASCEGPKSSNDNSDYRQYWPQWRGPLANGVAPSSDPPIEWAEDENIRWKIEIPGKGHGSPIIWGKQVFVLTAIPVDGEQMEPTPTEEPSQPANRSGRRGRRRGIQPKSALKFTILSFNRENGELLWQHTAREAVPHEGTHGTATWASGSAVTDGEQLFAYFGSYGLYAYDMQGNSLWQIDLGDMTTRNAFGEGSSPVLFGNTLVINWDHEGESFIVALNKKTGKELWRENRDERTSWSTPIVVEQNGKPQVIVSATNFVRGYDLSTGELIWQSGGMTANTIPSPIYANNLVYVASGFRGSALHAIRLADAKSDITGSEAIVWQHERDTPYVPSPLVYDDHIYFLKSNRAILSCLDAKTGEIHYNEKRLEGVDGVYASIVGAKDRVYIIGRNGTSVVIKHGSEFETLATNSLDDSFDASPAIVGKEMYLRGGRFLYCVSIDKAASSRTD